MYSCHYGKPGIGTDIQIRRYHPDAQQDQQCVSTGKQDDSSHAQNTNFPDTRLCVVSLDFGQTCAVNEYLACCLQQSFHFGILSGILWEWRGTKKCGLGLQE